MGRSLITVAVALWFGTCVVLADEPEQTSPPVRPRERAASPAPAQARACRGKKLAAEKSRRRGGIFRRGDNACRAAGADNGRGGSRRAGKKRQSSAHAGRAPVE